MEAVFTKEAALMLEGLLAAGANTNGFLIGRIQGNSCYITELLPTGRVFTTRLERIVAVDDLYDGHLQGVFVFGDEQRNNKRFLAPWGFGKILVTILQDADGTASVKASLVDFDKDFFLKDIKIHTPFKEKQGEPAS